MYNGRSPTLPCSDGWSHGSSFSSISEECGADITVTEFTAAAGLNRDDARSWRRLESDPRESPFIPQIFGGVEEMVGTTRALSSVADIIDLNFGCPEAPKSM